MTEDEVNSAKSDRNLAKESVKWATIIVAGLLAVVYLFWIIWGFNYDKRFIDIMYEHLAAVIGVPGSIIVAFLLVSVLENVSGAIKFEGLGFKFEGASGPIVMWVIVFLSLIGGIRLLW